MNKVILIGNLTRDPETSTTASGITMCRFSIAVNRRFGKDNNEADYFNVIAWRALGENCGNKNPKIIVFEFQRLWKTYTADCTLESCLVKSACIRI